MERKNWNKRLYLGVTLLSCKVDNGYNYNEPDPNTSSKHFSFDYEFGSFVVKNVTDRDNDSFSLSDQNSAGILFKVVHDCDNLPLQDSMTARYIEDDDYNASFYNMPGGNIGTQIVHKGLMVAYITYEDGSESIRRINTDIFNGKKSGDEILIVNDINKTCKIEIAICFEIGMWAPGFLGISGQYWVNYRINKTINFKVL